MEILFHKIFSTQDIGILLSLAHIVPADVPSAHTHLKIFILFRLLQVLGAYGFRGWTEHKANFVTSIPAAVESLKELVADGFDDFSYLADTLRRLTELTRFAGPVADDGKLEVKIYSFSFKKGAAA